MITRVKGGWIQIWNLFLWLNRSGVCWFKKEFKMWMVERSVYMYLSFNWCSHQSVKEKRNNGTWVLVMRSTNQDMVSPIYLFDLTSIAVSILGISAILAWNGQLGNHQENWSWKSKIQNYFWIHQQWWDLNIPILRWVNLPNSVVITILLPSIQHVSFVIKFIHTILLFPQLSFTFDFNSEFRLASKWVVECPKRKSFSSLRIRDILNQENLCVLYDSHIISFVGLWSIWWVYLRWNR